MKLRNLFFAALISFSANTFAQDTNEDAHTVQISIPEVALLDLESSTGTAISLKGTIPTEAGEAVTFNATNSDSWINYSSIVGSTSNPTRSVSVKITDGEVPQGLDLTVKAAVDASKGDGAMGTPDSNPIKLTATATTIIDGIGSAYTGDVAKTGHQLTYKLAQSAAAGSYAKLDFDKTQTLTITYTLSDN